MRDDDRVGPVVRLYEGLCARDWDAVAETFAEDAVFGMSGRNPFAGEYRGRQAIVDAFREVVQRSGDTLRPVRADTWDVCVSDHHVILFERFQAQRDDRTLRAYLYFVSAVEDGRVARMFAHSSEQYEFDAFWE